MSNVGAQSVSMGDLMKLGVPALNAMAQGQQSSIAPSYMVISALKALTDQQKGMQQPVPNGTIKDQLVAQTAPPVGIAQLQPGAMPPQPVKGFSGADGESQVRGSWVDSLPEGAGIHSIMRYLRNPNRKPLLDEIFSSREEPPPLPKGTQATIPSLPMMPIPEVPGYEEASSPQPRTQMPATDSVRESARNSITASASSRGVGAAGNNPLAKYETLDPTPSAASFQLDIPKNQQLADAAAKYASPDEARMAELKAAESRAGLGAFARGMLDTRNGTGFGAVFGRAAADSNDATEARADKRREYEDRRADVARELGIKVGDQGRQDFITKTDYGDKRAEEARKAELESKTFGNTTTARQNEEVLKLRQLEIEAEKVRATLSQVAETAAARKDGKLQALIASIADKREKAVSDTKADVYAKHKDNPMWAMKSDPKVVFKVESEAAMAAQAADARYMVMLKPMLREMGVPTE